MKMGCCQARLFVDIFCFSSPIGPELLPRGLDYLTRIPWGKVELRNSHDKFVRIRTFYRILIHGCCNVIIRDTGRHRIIDEACAWLKRRVYSCGVWTSRLHPSIQVVSDDLRRTRVPYKRHAPSNRLNPAASQGLRCRRIRGIADKGNAPGGDARGLGSEGDRKGYALSGGKSHWKNDTTERKPCSIPAHRGYRNSRCTRGEGARLSGATT